MGNAADVKRDVELSTLLVEMRDLYEHGKYQLVLMKFEEFGDISAVRSGLRVDAICYAARARAKLKQPREALALMKRTGRGNWTNPALFAHIASTYIELRDYQTALEFLEQAAKISRSTSSAA